MQVPERTVANGNIGRDSRASADSRKHLRASDVNFGASLRDQIRKGETENERGKKEQERGMCGTYGRRWRFERIKMFFFSVDKARDPDFSSVFIRDFIRCDARSIRKTSAW